MGDAADNIANINTGASVTGGVTGGSSGSGNALPNIVTTNDGTVEEIGADYTESGRAEYNVVTMSSGTVTAAVAGGLRLGRSF